MLNRFFGNLEQGYKIKDANLPPPEYKKYVINPVTNNKPLSDEELEEKAKEIFEWAKANGATHYTFWAYPQTDGVCEKQDQFLDLKYFFENSLSSEAVTKFSSETLLKCEGDGSSFPSGGLRQTHSARCYMMWDPKSEIFLRKRSGVLYIPSILVAHDGSGLCDKTLLRKCENILEEKTLKILEHLNIKASNSYMALGMEQEFFIVPKSAYLKRLDLRSTGRALINDLPPRNQQFSDHYYGKLPAKVEDIFKEVERELFEIGVPVKTRHKEVAINQFEFVPLYEEAGKAIDHNMISMEVLKEVFDRYGFTVLLHEKPFNHLNGSGKHCNWSLNYIDENKKPCNLFKVPRNGTDRQKAIFKLFVLMNMNALVRNGKLYLSSISTANNELRLGGHQAPPRIISSFLGDTVTGLIEDKCLNDIENFKDKLPNINYDVYQEDTDRNRTSPYAFAGNKFQFRAVGSSQNASYPMAVIGATLAYEMEIVLKRFEKGDKLEDIVADLTESSRSARFEGDGYAKTWPEEAKKRGLYVNYDFAESIENLKTCADVFADIGACNKEVIRAKYNNQVNLYINTVNTEARTISTLMSREIIPRCYEFANRIQNFKESSLVERKDSFMKVFEELCVVEKKLIEDMKKSDLTISEACERRKFVNSICEKVNENLAFLPKTQSWPDLEDFMNIY